ncbi:phosphoenolpyruvate--protein phosphotransferase [Verticiella sediminum]
MGVAVPDKEAALALLARELQADGLVREGYLKGLQAREAQGVTYLGQGIAIPHGTPETRELVERTGVRLLQFPDGVDWGQGQMVYLAIGIAARSDEHLRLLQMLTRALGEADLADALRQANTPDAILGLLQSAPKELELDRRLIGLDTPAEDVDELIIQGVRLLRRADCVGREFAAEVLGEEPMPLGGGLWWVSSEAGVLRPALAYLKPERPLRHRGQPVEGLLCLASTGDAHLKLLDRLCELLLSGRSGELTQARASRDVLEALGGEAVPEWPAVRVRLANAHGLHARPARELVQLAKQFEGDVRVRLVDSDGPAVSAKSLSKLLSLGVYRGQTIELLAEPAIADRALPLLRAAIEQGLGEPVEPLSEVVPAAPLPTQAQADMEQEPPAQAPLLGSWLHAVPAAPGVAIGPVHLQLACALEYPSRGESPAIERERLAAALAEARAEVEALVARSEAKAVRDIFGAHLEMLADPALTDEVHARLQQGESAEAAWATVIEEAAVAQERLQDAVLAERAADLRDIGRRVLGRLCGVAEVTAPDEPYVLVMAEMTPSDVARLDRERVAGLLTARGGATAHSAIVARALGIPALVGAGDGVLLLAEGTRVLLDGQRGRLLVGPDDAQVEHAREEQHRRAERLRLAEAHKLEPARTRDGHAVEVAANLGDSAGAAKAMAQGAEGVGLLRTEFIFMAQPQAPDLATQEAEYRRVFDALDGRPLVARTLDVGGDKPLPYWPVPHEDNPFLGVRGIRLTLRRPQLMETQLRALLRASDGRPLRIMFPMVGGVDEWRQAREMTRLLAREIPQADLQLGIMVEVPSAVMLAPVLAREVDFFSIGTNDLTQYCLAIDRGHPTLSAQADGLHPAVLRMIDMTVRAAHAEGKWVGVCGELAGDPLAVPLLVGLGVDELSLSPGGIPEVKARVRELQYSTAVELAATALTLDGAAAVRALAERF